MLTIAELKLQAYQLWFLVHFSKLRINVFYIVLIAINFLCFVELIIFFIFENILASFDTNFISKRKPTDKLTFRFDIHLNSNDFSALVIFLKHIFVVKFSPILAELSKLAISLLGL